MRQQVFVLCVLCAFMGVSCAASTADYGGTRVLVAGQEVESLPEEPGEAERLNALRSDLAELEQKLDLAPASEDELPVLHFTLGSRLRYVASAYQKSPARADLKLLLARHYWLLARCQRLGSDHLALALLRDLAQEEAPNADVHLYKARILLAQGLYEPAAQALRAAQDAGLDPASVFDWGLLEAKRLYAQGQRPQARQRLSEHLTAHPDDLNAKLLALTWDAGTEGQIIPAGGGASQVRSLVRYTLHPTHWTLAHETLGILVDLPLDWQLAEATVNPDTSGVLQLISPPRASEGRQWSTATATLWVVPTSPGEDLDTFTLSYTESLPPGTTLSAPRNTQRHGLVQRTLALEILRDNQPWQGVAVLMTDGQMGYVVEVWGEAQGFTDVLEDARLLLETFRPAQGAVSSAFLPALP